MHHGPLEARGHARASSVRETTETFSENFALFLFLNQLQIARLVRLFSSRLEKQTVGLPRSHFDEKVVTASSSLSRCCDRSPIDDYNKCVHVRRDKPESLTSQSPRLFNVVFFCGRRAFVFDMMFCSCTSTAMTCEVKKRKFKPSGMNSYDNCPRSLCADAAPSAASMPVESPSNAIYIDIVLTTHR